MISRIKKNEATASLRRVPIYCVDATDGFTPEAGETGGQPKVSINGAGENNTAGVLVAVNAALGRYYVELSQAETNNSGWLWISYKSAATRDCDVIIQVEDALISDVYDRIGAPIAASISADIAVVDANVDTLLTRVTAAVYTAWTKLADVAMAGTEAAGSLIKRIYDNLDAAVSSRLATSGYTAPDNAGITAIKAKTDQLIFTIANKVDASIQAAADFAQAAADKVWATATRAITDKAGFSLTTAQEDALVDKTWDEPIAGHLGAGSTGEKLNSAASAGDPWTTPLPGAYGAGTAGKIVGDNLNATVLSRSSHSAADVWAVGTRTLTSFGTLVSDIWAYSSRTLTSLGSSLVAEIWNALTSGMTTAGSVGKRIADNLDATISSRSTLTATDVWASATRTLTSFGTLVSDIWSNVTRTLTGFGTLVSDIWSHDLSTTDEDVITGRKGASVLMALFKRFYYKVTQSGTQQIVYKADNITPLATMSTTEGPPQEKAKAA